MGRLSVGARQLVLTLLSSAALRTAKAKPLLEDHQDWLDCVASPATCTTLNLFNALSGGTIPDAIGDLTALTYLSLGDNQFMGTIPSSIGDLTALAQLYLNSNQLSGTIPADAIRRLTALKSLWLYKNQLDGHQDPEGRAKNSPARAKWF